MSASFSMRISELRKRKNISQRQAANDLGISQALLSHYENGLREPKLEFVVKVCDYYGVSADYVLGRTDKIGSGEEIDALISQVKNLYDYTNELFITDKRTRK